MSKTKYADEMLQFFGTILLSDSYDPWHFNIDIEWYSDLTYLVTFNGRGYEIVLTAKSWEPSPTHPV